MAQQGDRKAPQLPPASVAQNPGVITLLPITSRFAQLWGDARVVFLLPPPPRVNSSWIIMISIIKRLNKFAMYPKAITFMPLAPQIHN